MDSGTSESSSGSPGGDDINPITEECDVSLPGHELVRDHAFRHQADLGDMKANNDYVELLRSAQAYDSTNDIDPPTITFVGELDDIIPGQIYEGMTFMNKDALQCALNGWSISNNVEYIKNTSNKTRLTVRCEQYDNPSRPCLWRLHAGKSKRLGGIWKVSSSGPPHICINHMMSAGHRNLHRIEVIGNNRFKSVFWAFGPTIEGWKFCRPVLSLDGMFLLGKYRGTLLAAVRIDGNGGLYPLAFAIVEAESNETWHAIVVAGARRWDYSTFVSPYYSIKLYQRSYANMFHVIPEKVYWPPFDEAEEMTDQGGKSHHRRQAQKASTAQSQAEEDNYIPSIAALGPSHRAAASDQGHEAEGTPIAGGYETMDSGTSESSSGSPGGDDINPITEECDVSLPGHELVRDHAFRHQADLGDMKANNDYVELLRSAQAYDSTNDIDPPTITFVGELDDIIPGQIYEGMTFMNKDALQCALNGWSISNNVEYIKNTSNKTRLTVRCEQYDNPSRPCLWRLHAGKSKRLGEIWKVSSSGPPHICINHMMYVGHRNLHRIEVIGNNRFKSVFWAFGPTIEGWKFCRPMLSLDGMFLLGKYRGTLLVAVWIDGNGGLYPLAFAIVEAESNETWV
ncbi:hypothetical protein M5K25_014703 [Dendrobium thyrsiflorum]|uniref:MULE transposase domain-containing protein n=1 Tax=Dendrobium thyrsiflorum TaxID=117978 RepID=A0ABD0UNF6_DENTH